MGIPRSRFPPIFVLQPGLGFWVRLRLQEFELCPRLAFCSVRDFDFLRCRGSSRIEILARVLARVGIRLRILARIRIPVRIKARFRILVKIPATIRIPVRITTRNRVSAVVRILQ